MTNGLALIADVGVPVLVFIIMLSVGFELRIADSRRTLANPRVVIAATLGQILILPLFGIAAVMLLAPSPALAAGMLLLALSPGGAVSNFFTHLSGRSTALSVTLTAISIFLSLVTVPVTAAIAFSALYLSDAVLIAPGLSILGQLLLFVVLPVGIGMALAARYTRLSAWHSRLRGVALALVALLLFAAIWTVRYDFFARLGELMLLAVVFVAGAACTGLLISRPVPADARHVVVIECTVRNVPIAILVGKNIVTDPAFAGFIAAYSLCEYGLLIPNALWLRRRWRS